MQPPHPGLDPKASAPWLGPNREAGLLDVAQRVPGMRGGRRVLRRGRGRTADAECAAAVPGRGCLSAAALYQRALTIQESVLPANDPMIARLVTNLGLSYRASGDLERAAPLLQRALPLYQAMRPSRSLKLANAQTHLGLLYRALGDPGRAEPLLVSALAL